MFITQAHSFRQQARLAVTLAWIAGYTNTVALLACGHVTSHVSGTTSELGIAAAQGNLRGAFFLGFLLVSFVLGAVLSGVVMEVAHRRQWESVYVLPMAIEALLLGLFAMAIEYGLGTLEEGSLGLGGWYLFAVPGLASTAMGLQNATVTRISAGVVRTTHVTGVLTDLGLEIVQLVVAARLSVRRGSGVKGWVRDASIVPGTKRVALLAGILGSFALGAGVGAALEGWAPAMAMFPPVLFLAWIVYQDITRPIAEIQPSELVGSSETIEIPSGIAVFRLRQDSRRRRGRVQRLPNLVAWADRLASDVRVTVLDLTDVWALDGDAASELKALTDRLAIVGRRLVIAGVTPEQYSQLIGAGWSERGRLGQVGACPDLELAIARAIAMLEPEI